MRSRLRSRQGFTLIEILVVIALTMVLSAVVLTYNSNGRDEVSLLAGSAQVAQFISRAKSFAIATYSETPAPCGYGVHIDYTGASNRYELFSYDVPNCGSILFIDPTNSGYKQLSTLTLPQGLKFLSVDNGADSVQDIFFIPPEPQTLVLVGNPESAVATANVVLSSVDGQEQRPVTVNSAGQITF